jgi:hypothetical protein
MRFEDTVTSFTQGQIGALTITTLDNRNEAIARGAEVSAKYKTSAKSWVYGNYTFESISDHTADAQVVTRTPGHKFNVGGQTALGAKLTASANWGWKDDYFISGPSRVAAASRLDVRLGYRPWSGVELFVAGQNLLAEQQMEFDVRSRVPRTYYAGLAIQWGGDPR